jgi:hypothetical protein
MSEERAVQQVLARYVRGTDARDGAAVAAVFTEDGRVEVSYNNSGKLEPLGELVGRETIATAVSQMMKPHPLRGWSHHTTHDHIIDVNGDDATLDAQFVVFEVRGKERPAAGWPGGGLGSGHRSAHRSGLLSTDPAAGGWRLEDHDDAYHPEHSLCVPGPVRLRTHSRDRKGQPNVSLLQLGKASSSRYAPR